MIIKKNPKERWNSLETFEQTLESPAQTFLGVLGNCMEIVKLDIYIYEDIEFYSADLEEENKNVMTDFNVYFKTLCTRCFNAH